MENHFPTPERLEEIEYLVIQSTKGIHLLFDKDTLRTKLQDPMRSDQDLTRENIQKVQGILMEMIQQPTLERKKYYLSTLEEDSYDLFIRTYFNIVENTVLEATSYPH